MDRSRRQSSSGSETSPSSEIQGSSDQTSDVSESISELNKRLESSLYVSKKPESKSTDAQADKQSGISKTSGLKGSRPERLSSQSSVKESPSGSYISRRVVTPEATKAIIDKPSSTIKKEVDQKRIVEIQRTTPYSRAKPDYESSYSLPSTQYFSNTYPKPYPPGYRGKSNPAFFQKSRNPVQQNQAYEYPRQYPQQSNMDLSIAHKQELDLNQYQKLYAEKGQNKTFMSQPTLHNRSGRKSPPTPQSQILPADTGTAARPKAFVSPRSHNQMLPISTNATPIRHIKGFAYYRNTMPPIRTNARPMRYVQRSSFNQNQMYRVTTNVTSMQPTQSLRYMTANTSGKARCSTDIIQCRLDSTANQDLKLAVTHPQTSVPKEIHSQNTSSPNPEESEKVTKLLELAKRTHYSKKNMLNVDIPPPATVPLTSFFPLYSTPQGGLLIRQLQHTPIQFPPPSDSGYLRSTFDPGRGVFSHQPYQHGAVGPQSYSHSYSEPRVANQSVSRPLTQDSNLIYSGSNAGNVIHPTVQSQFETPQRAQYQPAIQSLTAMPQYQNTNTSIYQYGTQYEPIMQNLTAQPQPQYQNHPTCPYGMQYQSDIQNLSAAPQYQDPNTSLCQYGTHYQGDIQNLTAVPQYQDPNTSIYLYGTQYEPNMKYPTAEHQTRDPNLSMFQYRTQYQPFMQNQRAEFQYQEPNYFMNQYRTHASFQTFWPPNTPWSCPAYDTRISSQQDNSNIVPMHSFATNPSSNSMIQNTAWPYGSRDQSYPFKGDPNLMQNISGMQTPVENPFSISMSEYPQGICATNESTNQICVADPGKNSNPPLIQNISGMQTPEENPFSISMSEYPQGTCATDESTNQICIEDPSQVSNPYHEYLSMNNPDEMQTNMYLPWSFLTDDPEENSLIAEKDEISKNE